MSEVTSEHAPGSERVAEVGGAARTYAVLAFVLLAPAVLGGFGTLVPAMLHPEGTIPLEGAWNRTLAFAVVVSTPVALLSPFATIPGLGFAVAGVRRLGMRQPLGRALAVMAALAVSVSAALVVLLLRVVEEQKAKGVWPS